MLFFKKPPRSLCEPAPARRPDHPQRVHTPNEPVDFPLHFHKALLRTVFGSSQKPAPPDRRNPTAPRTLALYPARRRFCFTEPIDVGWPCAERLSDWTVARREGMAGLLISKRSAP